jgi:Raf kinase inhibitor-like YbhB/YbcL family protein
MAETRSGLISVCPGIIAACALTFAIAAGAAESRFKLHSPTVTPNSMLSNDQVYSGFGCSGKNISPALGWSGAPSGTKSFALTVYDPDAPTGSGWWHWVVYNIPASVTELPAGAGNAGGQLPAGAVQGHTDFGTSGFGGPCPPVGDKPHRYIFTVYALKSDKISVPDEASAAMVAFMIHANMLAKARLMARYGR